MLHHAVCAEIARLQNLLNDDDSDDSDDEDGEALHDIDMEELLKDYEEKTGWEKLKNYIGSLQDTYGEEEVDNVGIEELG